MVKIPVQLGADDEVAPVVARTSGGSTEDTSIQCAEAVKYPHATERIAGPHRAANGTYGRFVRLKSAANAQMGSTMSAAASHPGAPRSSAKVAASDAITTKGEHHSRALSD